jgi:hypothetical protein
VDTSTSLPSTAQKNLKGQIYKPGQIIIDIARKTLSKSINKKHVSPGYEKVYIESIGYWVYEGFE